MSTTQWQSTSPLLARLGTLLAVILAVNAAASAADLSTQKRFGKWSLTPSAYFMGSNLNTAALSPKWIVVGATGAEDRGAAEEGGVQVFSANKGAFVRKLLPPGAPVASQAFGSAAAISGDIAVVGAYHTSANRGIAYLYNLATGRLLHTLSADDGAVNDYFGFNVATNGTVAAISAHGDDTSRGSIYLFNVATGAQIAKIQASDGSSSNFFGYGLAMEGNIIAVGADGVDANKGAVYFFDASTQLLILKYQPGTWALNDHYGSSLSMHQGRVVIGSFESGKAWRYDLATLSGGPLSVGGSGSSFGSSVAISGPLMAVSEPSAGSGEVHLFNSQTGTFVQTLLPPNGDTNAQRFGYALALDGNTLLATAPDDSVQAVNAGAAHLIKPLIRPMEYTKVVGKGDFAPGAPDISYSTFSEAFINASQQVTFSSKLSGSGSNGGRDWGVFSSVVAADSQQLVFKTRQTYSGTAMFGIPSLLSSNDGGLAIGLSTLTGPGVTALNNQLLWAKTTAAPFALIRAGTPFSSGSLAGTTPKAILALGSGNLSGGKLISAICILRQGLGGTNATNDSALYSTEVGGAEQVVREGLASPGLLPPGSHLGQIAPRLAMHYNQTTFSSALVDTGITSANNAALFRTLPGASLFVVAQKGDLAVDGTGAFFSDVKYSGFIGESSTGEKGEIYRATLSGPTTSVNTTNNEGLWSLTYTGFRKLAFRKGQDIAPLTGLKIARILKFWGSGNAPSAVQCLATVQLKGSGVTAANDQALLLWQTDGSINVLLREGDAAPGCPGAKIGVISRVESNAYGMTYAVLTTLTGTTPNSNLALYTGGVSRGNPTSQAALRRPFLRLRKGQVFDNQPSMIKSILLPTTTITASGAGSTGLGHAISWAANFTFIVEFDNGVRQIMKGTTN